MKKGTILVLALFMLISFVSCGESPELEESRCGRPTDFELSLVKPYIPQGFELQNSRRVDLSNPYIFVSYSNSETRNIGISVFVLQGNHIKKYYQMPPIFGEEIYFGLSREEDYWGNDEIIYGSYVCPVEFSLGGNMWSNNFVKILTVNDLELKEINISLEPWTIIMDIIDEKGEKIIRVLDTRLEYFSDMIHAAAPSRVYFYALRGDEFVDVTREHIDYVRERVHSSIIQYKQNKGDDKAHYRIGYGIEAYLYAEAGGITDEYIGDILDMLDPVAFDGDDASLAAEARNLVNMAYEQKKPIINLRGFNVDFDDDNRWGVLKFNEFEVAK